VSIAAFDPGDLIRLGNHVGDNPDDSTRTAFLNAAGVATDPTAVLLEVRKPDGTVLEYGWPTAGDTGTLIKETGQTGRFYFDVSLTASGPWFWKLASTGTVQTSMEGELWCRSTSFA
jgi:hypothetical protein